MSETGGFVLSHNSNKTMMLDAKMCFYEVSTSVIIHHLGGREMQL